MSFPEQFLLSDLLSHSVRCDEGIDHGTGVIPWMHPPVHRILGWVTRPSVLNLSRNVWSLNQLKGINQNIIYVKGPPTLSNQETLDRLPTLIDAQLLNNKNLRIGIIADFVFQPNTGKILYYLVSRTDPRIPGTSRWRLMKDKIIDQQPGIVLSNLNNLNDLPLVKSSIRQDIIKRSKNLRQQFQEISDKASLRLEGWLEETNWDSDSIDFHEENSVTKNTTNNVSLDDWIDESDYDAFNESKDPDFYRDTSYTQDIIEEEDPWV